MAAYACVVLSLQGYTYDRIWHTWSNKQSIKITSTLKCVWDYITSMTVVMWWYFLCFWSKSWLLRLLNNIKNCINKGGYGLNKDLLKEYKIHCFFHNNFMKLSENSCFSHSCCKYTLTFQINRKKLKYMF